MKVDPKSVGVGQYQHDVSETLLEAKLDEVVESCVNRVGVELNTASPSLLGRVSGIGEKLAQRNRGIPKAHGRFVSRQQLTQVHGLGARTFEQAAGFLRVHGAEHPLDASGVHPERYRLVESMARDLGASASGTCFGSLGCSKRLERSKYLPADVGDYPRSHRCRAEAAGS
ncbi:MAG: helix-hairpin-helix domain-containing protein [Myxococcales bacterium]|nr:helix-hairpin-helix domain-containing protein [Myxococcales bacterium]